MKYANFLLASQKGLAKTAMIILANLCLSGYDCIEAIICSNVMPVISQYADKVVDNSYISINCLKLYKTYFITKSI